MLTYLKLVTPELTDGERHKYFGGRSANEQYEIAQMLEGATEAQRSTVYAIIESYAGELCQLTMPQLN